MLLDVSNSVDLGTLGTIVISVVTGIIGGIVGFFIAKAGIKRKINEVEKDVNKDISELKIRMEKLHSRDDLQQQFIDQFDKNVGSLLNTIILEKLEEINNGKTKSNGRKK